MPTEAMLDRLRTSSTTPMPCSMTRVYRLQGTTPAGDQVYAEFPRLPLFHEFDGHWRRMGK